jgi:hypothetical protein
VTNDTKRQTNPEPESDASRVGVTKGIAFTPIIITCTVQTYTTSTVVNNAEFHIGKKPY